MSVILRGIGRHLVAILLSLFAGAAQSTADWLDEMPTVPAVVQAVREQFEVKSRTNPALARDADEFAEHMAGTFVLLRWVMQVAIEEDGLSPTKAARQSKLRAISLSYQQAELAIGLGAGKRKGYVVVICARLDSWSRAQWAVLDECHRRSFYTGLGRVYRDAAHRRAIFARLFCTRAPYFLDLMERRPPKAPLPVTPALTRQMPDGEPNIGRAFCQPYGGDANVNGLCDAWEKPLLASSGSAACFQLVGVKRIDSKHVRVEFTRTGGGGTPSVQFALARIDRESGDEIPIKVEVVRDSWEAAGEIPGQPATLHPRPECRDEHLAQAVGARATPEAVMVRTLGEGALKPNPSHPWLVVRALSGGVQIGPTTQCKQPVPVPTYVGFARDLEQRRAVGLFGPYPTADQAAIEAEPLARDYADANLRWGRYAEVGALLVASSDGKVYVTQLVLGPLAWRYGKPGLIGSKENEESVDRAFTHSCERKEDFYPVAIMHTHPRGDNQFSDADWLAASCWRQPENSKTFKGSYLFRADGCVEKIDGTSPTPNDKLVVKVNPEACPR